MHKRAIISYCTHLYVVYLCILARSMQAEHCFHPVLDNFE